MDVPANPLSIAYSPSGNCLAVASQATDKLSIFRVNQDCTLTEIQGSPLNIGFAVSVKYSPDGKCLSVASSASGNVNVFEVNQDCSLTKIQELPIGTAFPAQALSYSTKSLCLAVASDTDLSIFRNFLVAPVLKNASVNDTNIRVTGTAEANSVISVFANGAQIGQGKTNAQGKFDFVIPTNLADNTYNITVNVSKSGCVSGASNTKQITINICTIATPVLKSAAINALGVIKVTGSSEANSIITVFADDIAVGFGQTNSQGSFDFSVKTNLQAGTFKISVNAINNKSCVSSASNSIEVTLNNLVISNLASAIINKFCPVSK